MSVIQNKSIYSEDLMQRLRENHAHPAGFNCVRCEAANFIEEITVLIKEHLAKTEGLNERNG